MEGANNTVKGHLVAAKLYNEKFAPNNGFRQFKDLTLAYLLEVDPVTGLLLFHLFCLFSGFLTQAISDQMKTGFFAWFCYTNFFELQECARL